LRAAEQDRPDVAAKRRRWRVEVTAHTEIDLDLDNATPAPGVIKNKCHDIRRKIEDELGAQL
jgi:hypothetical protein